MTDYQNILVPYDFSVHARAALTHAAELALRLTSELHLLHVVQPPAHAFFHSSDRAATVTEMKKARESAMTSLREVMTRLKALPSKVEPHVVEGESVADAIQRSARSLDVGLIVMGTHGRTGWAHTFIGSVAERTLRGAPCAVLTVRADEEDDR